MLATFVHQATVSPSGIVCPTLSVPVGHVLATFVHQATVSPSGIVCPTLSVPVGHVLATFVHQATVSPSGIVCPTLSVPVGHWVGTTSTHTPFFRSCPSGHLSTQTPNKFSLPSGQSAQILLSKSHVPPLSLHLLWAVGVGAGLVEVEPGGQVLSSIGVTGVPSASQQLIGTVATVSSESKGLLVKGKSVGHEAAVTTLDSPLAFQQVIDDAVVIVSSGQVLVFNVGVSPHIFQNGVHSIIFVVA